MAVEDQTPVPPTRFVVVDGKKFLWDGQVFESTEEAASAIEAYKHDNFEVHLVEQGQKHLVYTRRVVKQVAVTAPE